MLDGAYKSSKVMVTSILRSKLRSFMHHRCSNSITTVRVIFDTIENPACKPHMACAWICNEGNCKCPRFVEIGYKYHYARTSGTGISNYLEGGRPFRCQSEEIRELQYKLADTQSTLMYVYLLLLNYLYACLCCP
jgi:hypothetical protein